MQGTRGVPTAVTTATSGVAKPAGGTVVERSRRNTFGRTEPTKREIQERAYFIYLSRGGQCGDPDADWVRAERELREELRANANANGGRRF